MPSSTSGDVAYGTSVVAPGKVGDEYYMTKGHFHTVLDTAEIYFCLAGRGYMLMENPEGDVQWAEFVPGSEDAPEAPCPLFPELAFQAKTAELRERYADWHTWFGPWTRQWWAAPRNRPGPAEMITEPTASALASHLDMLQDPEPGRPDTEPESRSACRIWRVTAEGRVESRLRGVEVEPAKVRHGLGGARQPVHASVLPFDRDRATVADAVQHPEHAFPVDVPAPRRDEVPAAAGVAPGEVRAEAAVPPV